MSSTRRHLLIGAGAVTALTLTACGGGSGAGSTDTGASGAKDATTIKLVAAEYSKDNTKAFWDAFAKTYKEKTGYTLEVNVVSWDNIDQQSSTMIQNNQAPDILNLNTYASYAKDDLLYSAEDVLSPEVKSDILDTFVKYGTYDGKFYGFPDLSSARAFFYNTDIFAKAGIDGPPKTWAELEADAKKITAGGDVGYAMPLGPEESQGEFSMWLFNNGGSWKNGKDWTINSPENTEALTFMRKLADEGLTQNNPAKTNRADAFDLFKGGKAGMVVGFSPWPRSPPRTVAPPTRSVSPTTSWPSRRRATRRRSRRSTTSTTPRTRSTPSSRRRASCPSPSPAWSTSPRTTP